MPGRGGVAARPAEGRIPMDADQELKRFKWVLLIGVAIAISGCFTLGELHWLFFGSTTKGTIVSITLVERAGRRGGTIVQQVRYTYVEADGTQRAGTDEVGEDHRFESMTQDIRYIAGSKDKSRLASNVRWTSLLTFVGALIAGGVVLWRTLREAYDYDDGKGGNRSGSSRAGRR